MSNGLVSAKLLLCVLAVMIILPRALHITARQLREFALPAQLTGLSFVPLGLGTVPVASWYGAIFAK
jgi:hypothetical protein